MKSNIAVNKNLQRIVLTSIRIFISNKFLLDYEAELFHWLTEQKQITNVQVVLIDSTEKASSSRSSVDGNLLHSLMDRVRIRCFRSIMKLERLFLSSQKNFRKCVNTSHIEEILSKYSHLNHATLQFNEVVSKSYEQQIFDECDLVLWLCEYDLSSNVISSSRLGVLNPTLPKISNTQISSLVFDSVVRQLAATEFRISSSKKGIFGTKTVFRGQCRTEYFATVTEYARNCYAMYYLRQMIIEAIKGDFSDRVSDGLFAGSNAPNVPKVSFQLRYLLSVTRRLLTKRVKKTFGWSGFPSWRVYYSSENWRLLNSRNHKMLPVLKGTFIADPFIATTQEGDFCFVEEMNLNTKRGHISVYQIGSTSAENLGVVIAEPFHMSFPYLFRYDEKLYMCPEIGEAREIRLYQCQDFPHVWSHYVTLMSDVKAADTMIFQHDNLWWMFTNFDPTDSGDSCVEMNIFWSDDPISTDWHPHAQNPVIVDSECARNGGMIHDDKISYRVAQSQGFAHYGEAMRVFRIDTLTPTDYVETCVDVFDKSRLGTKHGVHHLYGGTNLTVFDGH